jgi:hypothetical protein
MVTLARNLVPDILCPTRLPCPQENNPRHTENLQSLVAGRLSLMHHRHPSPHNFRVSVLPGSVSRFQIPSSSSSSTFLSHAIFLLPGVTHIKAHWVRLAQIPYRPWYRAVDDESTKDTCSPSMKSTLPLHATSMPIRESQIPGEPVVRLPLQRYFPPCSLWRGRRRIRACGGTTIPAHMHAYLFQLPRCAANSSIRPLDHPGTVMTTIMYLQSFTCALDLSLPKRLTRHPVLYREKYSGKRTEDVIVR